MQRFVRNLTAIFLVGLCSAAFAAASSEDVQQPKSALNSTQLALGGAIGGTAFMAVLAVGFFLYRRGRSQGPGSPSAAKNRKTRVPIRTVNRPSRSSSIMLRHAVANSKSKLGVPAPSMKRGGRRKGAPTAIMVEVLPASVSLGVPVATPSDANNHLAVQSTVGLHVPPSPAYDFRGRAAGEMPKTPRTPCMGATTSGSAIADRMV